MPQNTGKPHGLRLTAALLLCWAVTDSHLVQTVPKSKTPSAADFRNCGPCKPGVSLPRPIRLRPIALCKADALLCKTLHSVQLRNIPQPPQRTWAEPSFTPHSPLHKKGTQSPSAGGGKVRSLPALSSRKNFSSKEKAYGCMRYSSASGS
jgi:hypothetical protein